MDITRLDPIQQLAFDAAHPVRGAFPVAILGNLKTRDFELVQLLDVPPDIHQMVVARNLIFIGVVGIVNGAPRSALEVPVDNAAIADLTVAYLKIVEAGMNARLEIAVLNRLWDIPADRMDA